MQVTNAVSPVSSTAPVAPPKPVDNARNAFASLLRQSTARAASPDNPASGADAAAGDENNQAEAQSSTPSKPRLKVADKPGPQRPPERGPKPAESQEATTPATKEEPPEATRAKRVDTSVADPSVPPWLAAAQHSLRTEAAARGAGEGDEADAGAFGERVAGSAHGDTAAQEARADADKQARLEGASASQDALARWAAGQRAESANPQQAGQILTEGHTGRQAAAIDTTPGAAALGAAAFNTQLGAARESAAPLTVNLPTPLAAPDFAQALGVQISVLAGDGVQRAELQLNPAEMGPVSVQIVIDGSNARVDFGADLAATRQVIEAGMPELAGALRDAGFTLAGGGVSQHAGGRSDSSGTPADTGRGSHGNGEADGPAPQHVTQRRRVAAGGVDLYA